MTKIYLPSEYLDKPCYEINENYIRVFDTTDKENNKIYDIYLNNNYLIKEGTSKFDNSITCDSLYDFTDDFYYRNDFDKILIIFVIFAFIIIYLPSKLFMKMFRKARL